MRAIMRASGWVALAMAATLSGCAGTAKPEVAAQPIVVCKNEAPLGTRFKTKVCTDRRLENSLEARDAKRQMMYGNGADTVGNPPGE